MESDVLNKLKLFLIDPRESLQVEAKSWLDLGDTGNKATLAKALLALANHGGGYILLGFDDTDGVLTPSPNRPVTLDAYAPDKINNIVKAYADPPFQCEVFQVPGPSGDEHPIIVVPGGHLGPILAKRGSPDNRTVQDRAIYIRRTGPQSEAPQTAFEWRNLIDQYVRAGREELISRMRDVFTGSVPQSPTTLQDEGQFDRWTNSCLTRWNSLAENLPADHPARCRLGHYWVAYQLRGNFQQVALHQLRELLARSTVKHSGWSPFWVPERLEIAPYVYDEALECWFGLNGQGAQSSPAHSDFWRVSPKGFGFLLTGYSEDGPAGSSSGTVSTGPGISFDLARPIHRIGESLLNAERLADAIKATDATMAIRVHYTGLAGRELVDLSGSRPFFERGCVAQQATITHDIVVQVADIRPNLPEVVFPLLAPLYELFSLFRLTSNLVNNELMRMRKRQF